MRYGVHSQAVFFYLLRIYKNRGGLSPWINPCFILLMLMDILNRQISCYLKTFCSEIFELKSNEEEYTLRLFLPPPLILLILLKPIEP